VGVAARRSVLGRRLVVQGRVAVADVEGSTRLWETQPDEMTVAVARLDQVLSDVVAAHDGVRPVEQGEGATPATCVPEAGTLRPRAAEALTVSGRGCFLSPVFDDAAQLLKQ
jgi:class 3 adenylate cyclase